MASDDQIPVLTMDGLRYLISVTSTDTAGGAEQPKLTVRFKLRERPNSGVVTTVSFTFDRLDMFLVRRNSELICSEILSCFQFSDEATAGTWAERISYTMTDTAVLQEREGSVGVVTVVFNIYALGLDEEERELVVVVEEEEEFGAVYTNTLVRVVEEDGDQAAAVLEKVRYDKSGGGEGFKEKSCAICLKDFCIEEEIAKPPPCTHIFHWECLCTWTKKSSTCPLCRCEIPLKDGVDESG